MASSPVHDPGECRNIRGSAFEFTVPWNTFVDPNARDQIQLQAFLGSGEPLPTWLQFDWSTATFSGVPGANGTLDVQLIANDGKGGRNSTRFDIVVGDPAPPARAVVSVPGWVIGDRTPTITWTRDSNAAYWDISIRNITTGTEFLRDQNVPSPTFTLPEVSSPTEFRVWVRTLNADNVSSGWSQGVNFTVSDVAPVRPTLNGPAAVTANAWPTITWNTDVNATRYDVEITNLDSGAVIFRDKQF
ncbi:MAG: putative Ig domain-containing protein, partial [Planctomycetota bacterium]|nr:putative Ig domain-containing protein [Planctomycetota bacterium]